MVVAGLLLFPMVQCKLEKLLLMGAKKMQIVRVDCLAHFSLAILVMLLSSMFLEETGMPPTSNSLITMDRSLTSTQSIFSRETPTNLSLPVFPAVTHS